MTRVRKSKGKSNKVKSIVIKDEAIYSTLYNYASQIVDKKREDGDNYKVDETLYEIAVITVTHFSKVGNRIAVRYKAKIAMKIMNYLNDVIGKVIEEDNEEYSYLRPEIILLLSFDYLLNKAKHYETIKTFAVFRLKIEGTIIRLKDTENIEKLFGYNQGNFMRMVGELPLEEKITFTKHTFSDKLKKSLQYKATLIFLILPLFKDSIQDESFLDALEQASPVIADLNTNASDSMRLDRKALLTYIDNNIFHDEDGDETTVTRTQLVYALLTTLATTKTSNIFVEHFIDIKANDEENIDLKQTPDTFENIEIAASILRDFEVEFS